MIDWDGGNIFIIEFFGYNVSVGVERGSVGFYKYEVFFWDVREMLLIKIVIR